MRVRYVPLTEKQWINHFQKGGGFRGLPYQRGAGLGSIFRTLFRAILPVAKSAGRAIGKRTLQAGAELASDLVAGKPLKTAAEKRVKEATGDLLQEASQKLKGGKRSTIKGRKKPRNQRTTQLGVIRS